MRNFKVTIAYNGAAYHGWQRQNNAYTVQEAFEDALQELIGEEITVNGCSRTDAGVHAREYVLSFMSGSTITCRGVVFGLNAILDDDIAVLRCEEVPEDFHARYSCKGKEYVYIVHNSEIKDPFCKYTAYRSWYPIDEKKLDMEAKSFIGTHDFKSFCSADCKKENTVRTIFDFRVERFADKVHFAVSGDGFLYNMVRIMVGTLLYVNDGKLPVGAVKEILGMKDRTKAGKTVPPGGLYLNKVFYKGNEDDEG